MTNTASHARARTVTPNVTRVERMKRKLQTRAGRVIYATRKTIVEPVFGQIKQVRGVSSVPLARLG